MTGVLVLKISGRAQVKYSSKIMALLYGHLRIILIGITFSELFEIVMEQFLSKAAQQKMAPIQF
jgi:hypothetical protein